MNDLLPRIGEKELYLKTLLPTPYTWSHKYIIGIYIQYIFIPVYNVSQ